MTDANDIIYDLELDQESELSLNNRYLLFMSEEELLEYWEANDNE